MHAVLIQPDALTPKSIAIGSIALVMMLVTIAIVIQMIFISPQQVRAEAIQSATLHQLVSLKTTKKKPLAVETLRVNKSLEHFADTLIDGGELVAPDNARISISPAQGQLAELARSLKQRIASKKNDQLVLSLNQIVALQQQRISQSNLLQLALWLSAMVPLIVLSVWLIVLLQKKVRRADALLAASLLENDTLLANTKDGLFIVKPNLQLGSVQSVAVSALFGVENPIAGDFIAFLQQRISPSDLLDIKNYVSGLLNEDLFGDSSETMGRFNEVAIRFKDVDGASSTRYLSFEFIFNELNPTAGLLVCVSDVTEVVEMRRALSTLSSQNEERFQLLIRSILPETTDVRSFFAATQDSLKRINELLRDDAQPHADTPKRLLDVLNAVVSIKSSAGSIGVSLMETSAREFEVAVRVLLDNAKVDSAHLRSLSKPLSRMISEFENLTVLTKKFNLNRTDDHAHLSSPALASRGLPSLSDKMQASARDLANTMGKKVTVTLLDFDFSMVRPETVDAVNAILQELVENAIIHSIEKPQARHNAGKPLVGSITIRMEENAGDQIRFYVQDDGAGFDFDALRKAAISLRIVDPDMGNKLSKNELVRLIFVNGFSTGSGSIRKRELGTGLEKVKLALSELSGKISVGSLDGVTAQFAVSMPTTVLVKPLLQ